MVRVSFIGCLLVGTVRVLIAAAARGGPSFCQIVEFTAIMNSGVLRPVAERGRA